MEGEKNDPAATPEPVPDVASLLCAAELKALRSELRTAIAEVKTERGTETAEHIKAFATLLSRSKNDARTAIKRYCHTIAMDPLLASETETTELFLFHAVHALCDHDTNVPDQEEIRAIIEECIIRPTRLAKGRPGQRKEEANERVDAEPRDAALSGSEKQN